MYCTLGVHTNHRLPCAIKAADWTSSCDDDIAEWPQTQKTFAKLRRANRKRWVRVFECLRVGLQQTNEAQHTHEHNYLIYHTHKLNTLNILYSNIVLHISTQIYRGTKKQQQDKPTHQHVLQRNIVHTFSRAAVACAFWTHNNERRKRNNNWVCDSWFCYPTAHPEHFSSLRWCTHNAHAQFTSTLWHWHLTWWDIFYADMHTSDSQANRASGWTKAKTSYISFYMHTNTIHSASRNVKPFIYNNYTQHAERCGQRDSWTNELMISPDMTHTKHTHTYYIILQQKNRRCPAFIFSIFSLASVCLIIRDERLGFCFIYIIKKETCVCVFFKSLYIYYYFVLISNIYINTYYINEFMFGQCVCLIFMFFSVARCFVDIWNTCWMLFDGLFNIYMETNTKSTTQLDTRLNRHNKGTYIRWDLAYYAQPRLEKRRGQTGSRHVAFPKNS